MQELEEKAKNIEIQLRDCAVMTKDVLEKLQRAMDFLENQICGLRNEINRRINV